MDRGVAGANGLRPVLYSFALLMERKLRENDGVKPHWMQSGLSVIFAHLQREVKELEQALNGDGDIGLEAADVACLAMMVADIASFAGRNP